MFITCALLEQINDDDDDNNVPTTLLVETVCINHTPAAPAHTGQCMNHAPAILAALALIFSMHRLLLVWITVAHFHLCSLLDRYTVLEVWAVRRPMRVCFGSRWGRCVLFINIWDSAVRPIQPMHAHTLAGAAAVVIVLSIFLIIFCIYSVIFCIRIVLASDRRSGIK